MKPTQNTTDELRTYTIDGIGDLPSVTTITKQVSKGGALIGWACKVMGQYLLEHRDDFIKDPEETIKKAKAEHKRISSEAMELGSAVHNCIEVYLKGKSVQGLLEAEPRVARPLEVFKEWEKKNDFKLIQSEHIVWSKEYRYAGTLDIVGTIKEVPFIVDLKTSTGIYPEMFMQIVAYKKAFEEMEKTQIPGLGILRLFKGDELSKSKVGYEWRDFSDEKLINLEWVKFLNLVNFWWASREAE